MTKPIQERSLYLRERDAHCMLHDLQVLLRPIRPPPFIHYIQARQHRLESNNHEQENAHPWGLGMYNLRHLGRYVLHHIAMRILECSLQPRELGLIATDCALDVLDSLIHGVELVGGHDIAGNLLMSALGVLRQLGDFTEEVVDGVRHDLDFVVEVLELCILGFVLRRRGVLEEWLLWWDVSLLLLLLLARDLSLLRRLIPSRLFTSKRGRGGQDQFVYFE